MLVPILFLLSALASALVINDEHAIEKLSPALPGADAALILPNDTTASPPLTFPRPRCNSAQFGRGLNLEDCQTVVSSLPNSAVTVTFGVRYDGTGHVYDRIMPLRWLS
ncbi:MAG: hypothetical protein Q9203_007337, partial [Teloschistes exilis]